MVQQTSQDNHIIITFDKSHLITIGERLYTESIELIRELVNNAYDADATTVKVTVAEDKIVIEDDGSGMDEAGLKQYFSIGSTEKKKHNHSPKYNRVRIGEFGIGKFASLAAAGHFEVSTRKDDFAATVTFDKEDWQNSHDQWHLPMKLDDPAAWRHNGTRISLSKLCKQFNIDDIERRILEGVPIKAEHFDVYLNGKKITARFIPGHRIPVFEGTEYGPISGELIVVASPALLFGGPGIDIKVKGATVKKELFGMETQAGLANLTGEVHADFLTVTSDRTNFLLDCPEYKSFHQAMRQTLERVLADLKNLEHKKEKKRVRRIANAAIDRVKEALKKNPDLAAMIGLPIDEEGEKKLTAKEASEKKPRKKRKTETQKRMTAKVLGPSAVITRLKMGRRGLSCQFEHFGQDAPESFSEGSVIYINEDHPLYIRESKNRERHIVNITRLLTQELSLLKNPKHSRQAFECQSRLITDALTKE